MPQAVLNIRKRFPDADHQHVVGGFVSGNPEELRFVRSALHGGSNFLQVDPRRDGTPYNGAALGCRGIQRQIQIQPGLYGFDQGVLAVFLRRETFDLFFQAVNDGSLFQRGAQDRIIQKRLGIHLGFGTKQGLFLGGITVKKTDRIQDGVLVVPKRQQVRTFPDKTLALQFVRQLRKLHTPE